MLCIGFRGARLCVKFSFFFVIALLGLTKGFEELRLFAGLGACICHELGHIFVMSVFGSAPREITFYGGGIKIVPRGERQVGRGGQTFILLAGCAVNFALAAVLRVFGAPETAVLVNVVLGCFNLLPFSYFDGGRIMKLWLPPAACDVIRALVILLSAAVISRLTLQGGLSPSLGATYILVLLSELAEER